MEAKICPKCGAAMDRDSSNCPACGSVTPVFAPARDQDESRPAVMDDALAAFVGEGRDYYSKKWGRFRGRWYQVFSWNWAAFFVPLYWFAYRKMYYLAAGLLFLSLATDLLPTRWISFGATLALGVLVPLFANWVYYRQACRKIERLKGTVSGDALEAAAAKAGGTNGFALGVTLLVVSALNLHWSYFMGK